MKRNRRILHVIPTIGGQHGGAPIACFDLCRELAKAGLEVSIYTTTIDAPYDWHMDQGGRTVRDGVEIRFFPVLGYRWYWISPMMYRALEANIPSCDVVHVHSLYRFHLPAAVHLCRKFGVPYIIKPHGSLDPFLFVRRRWRKSVHEMLFERPAICGAAAIQFTTDEERDLALRTSLFGKQKSRVAEADRKYGEGSEPTQRSRNVVIAEGLSLDSGKAASDGGEKFLDRYPHLRGRELVLYLGRINFKKGLDILARAFGKVARIRPEAELVIAGPDQEGYAEQVRRWLIQEGVAERTTFTGMLWNQEKWSALCAADVFVLPSYTENFGLAVVEAMIAGCPVIISDKVNIWREISGVRAGIVVPCDVQQTADAITGLLANPERARELATNALQLVEQKFTWESVIVKMTELYDTLVVREAERG
ncbi:MAG: hypothetical protein A3G25_09930 [Betaproteobacteria bacterium RIFCSPLOWO2_12_FULL_63_13]|nr:MAG: hypothetical protein A3G25_09930 [Betaproteobacteria bacterium RIFCSPLOWO2_12_FULL_63_13]